jgi:hypothetical protein
MDGPPKPTRKSRREKTMTALLPIVIATIVMFLIIASSMIAIYRNTVKHDGMYGDFCEFDI